MNGDPTGVPEDLDRETLKGLTLEAALVEVGLGDKYTDKHIDHLPWPEREKMFANLDPPYIPSPGQRAFHQSPARIKVLTAGARYGKSMSAARDVLDLVLQPNSHGWVLGPTYDLAEKEWAYLEADLEALGILKLATRHSRGKPGYLEFPWGAKVWMRSADNPTSLLGEELDWVIVCEASQINARIITRYLRARMGSRQGRIIIPTTPFGMNWVRDFFEIAKSQEGLTDKDWKETFEAWQFSVLENPTFDPGEYLAAAELLPPEEFAEQYDGCFREMAGRIVSTFSTIRHVFETIPHELHTLPVFRTIDFGHTNPTCVLWVVYDREGLHYGDGNKAVASSWWVVAEYYERNVITPDLAQHILGHEWSLNHRVVVTIGDMAAAQERATLGRYGVPCAKELSRAHPDKHLKDEPSTIPIQKAWDAGVRTLRTLAHQGRIRVHSSCKNLIRELQTYVFAENSDKAALDQDDHAVDALRYLAHTVTPA